VAACTESSATLTARPPSTRPSTLESIHIEASSSTPEPSLTSTAPAADGSIYFDALAVEGDDLTDPITSVDGRHGKDLYITREGGSARRLVATTAHEHCPRVSPDGSMLAYLVNGVDRGGTVVVRRLYTSGGPGRTTASVSYTGFLSCPQWSPDGQQLAVAIAGYDAPDQTLEVRVIQVDGTDRLLATQRDQWMPPSDIAWSPTGDAIAFITPDSVWVAPLDDGDPERLWQGRPTQDPNWFGAPPAGTPKRLSWLPTGEVAVSTFSDVDEHEVLRLLDPDSGRDRVLGTFPMSEPASWAWSPDGSRLVFSDTDGGIQMFDRPRGKTVPLRPRLHGRRLAVWELAWSPDGQRLVGTTHNPSGDGFGLVSMDPDGSSVDVLTPWVMALYSDADASWRPR
jgi:Tol biopolymer transport system component